MGSGVWVEGQPLVVAIRRPVWPNPEVESRDKAGLRMGGIQNV